MKVPANVLAALRAATTDGSCLLLTGPRMTPKLYQRVNEVIEGAGGRWDKAAQAHVFPGDAAEAIAPVLASGYVTTLREVRQASQYFPTPPTVVARLVALAELAPCMVVLEPSAGRGAIAAAVVERGCVVDCIERDPEHAGALRETGTARKLTVADFLTVPPEPKYDRVVMNPPFTKGADVQHVTHALRFLAPGGLLAAVMSWAVTWQGGEAARFRALVEQRGGSVDAVSEGAFAESGTDVDTVLVTIPASRPADARPVIWPTRDVPAAAVEEFRDPAQIAAEIAANLREAMNIMEELARDLAKPAASRPPVKPVVADLPLPRKPQEQLSFDELGEAS
ncbi:methyltransferase [Streptomyces sp. NPDC054933]